MQAGNGGGVTPSKPEGESKCCRVCADNPERSFDPYQAIDRTFQGQLARLTLGVSPVGITIAYLNWWAHWMLSPGHQSKSLLSGIDRCFQLMYFTLDVVVNADPPHGVLPRPNDNSFRNTSLCVWPFNVMSEAFLHSREWLQESIAGVRGVPARQEQMLCFIGRQVLDMFAPNNFLFSNPEVIHTTQKEFGLNLWRGLGHFLEDGYRMVKGKRPVGAENYQVGKDVATTPGKVIYRNGLIELIQYCPTTQSVFQNPVLIVPAWIMKYYILDLSPSKSLVKYLVDKGHTVFMISWINPTTDEREVSMEDYRERGVMAAINAISSIVPKQRINAMGYCLGGTMLMIAAATMARQGDQRLLSITLLAAQVEFSEAGELALFIGESEVAFLDAMMAVRGYLDTQWMSAAFQMLRSNDLIWSRMIREYLLGRRQPMNDLMAWNSDFTRMPYRMYSEYLHSLFLHNALAEGQYRVDEHHIHISDIRVPVFCVGTEDDHVAPWRSVYKINLLADTEVTFLLTNGGHNAGIISEPDHPRRRYRLITRRKASKYVDPDSWLRTGQEQKGVWWLPWQEWLKGHSANSVDPPPLGNTKAGLPPLMEAPGSYVLQA
jgi:poly[(R)-3-hydroxyalkanoate] polymerase subunit PhaC